MNREQWRDRMCARIRFWPDRRAVWEELKHHMDDKRDELIAAGMTIHEAERRAVEAMGDPEEVGRRMNAVHKPWLGWLWKISGWLAVLLGAAAVLCLIFCGSYWLTEAGGQELQPPEGAETVTAYACSSTDTVNGIRFSVAEVQLSEGAMGSPSEGWPESSRRLDVRVRVSAVGWDAPWMIYDSIWMTDDQGRRYEVFEGDVTRRLSVSWDAVSPLAGDLYFTLHYLPEDVRWVSIRYDRGGRELTLRIDLRGGAADDR